LVAVIPLSTSPPENVQDYHASLILERPLPAPFDAKSMWAKCDMIATLSLTRLDRFKMSRQNGGQRQWISGQFGDSDIQRIKAGVLHGLGLGSLTVHL
jgi:mRNA interferase MazF